MKYHSRHLDTHALVEYTAKCSTDVGSFWMLRLFSEAYVWGMRRSHRTGKEKGISRELQTKQ